MDLTLSPETLLAQLGTAQAPCLIDVCVAQDVAADPWRLPGAWRVDHTDDKHLADLAVQRRAVVVICQKGLKLSHGVAARLRARGLCAKALEGGVLRWGAAGLPRVHEAYAPCRCVLAVPQTVTELMQLWAIRRWIAPRAEVLWVPNDMVTEVAIRFEGLAVTHSHDLLQDAGLDWAPLTDFLTARAAPWTALLDALPKLYPTPEAVADAALPLIDAGWTAFREDSA